MIRATAFAVALVLGSSALAAAQDGPPAMGAPSPFEEFANKLKLDKKTQLPKVEQLFTVAATDAVPIGQELTQLRQRLVNIHLTGRADDLAAAVEATVTSAAKMAALEARAFASVYELLEPKQQPKAAEAFALMAGLFQPSTRGGRGGGGAPGGGRGGRGGGGALMNVAMGAAPVAVAAPQRGGGGGGGGGGDMSFGTVAPSRFGTLKTAFALEKDQEKPVKALFDEAQKSAAPMRQALKTTRDGLAAAIAAKAAPADLDQAVRAYATPVAAMTNLEMKALADMLKSLLPAQRANQGAVQTAFFMMRGMFLDEKKWDKTPDGRAY